MLFQDGYTAEENILLVLAQEKSGTYYELWKKDKVASSNKTILAKLSLLEKEKLIQSSREKSGRRKKSYKLTMLGLIVALRYDCVFKRIDRVAETHAQMLPLVFGKWHFFREKGILEEFIERLRSSIVRLWSEMYSLSFAPESLRELLLIKEGSLDLKTPRLSPKKSEMRGWLDINDLFLGLDRLTSHFIGTLEREKMENYLRVLKQDSDLKSFVDGFINFYDIYSAQAKENYESWKSWWKSL